MLSEESRLLLPIQTGEITVVSRAIMEDEDGEGRVEDTWNILADQQVKDSVLDSALKQTKDGTYTDRVEEEKPVIRFNSIGGKESPGKGSATGTKIVFKGFKKRILAQTQESQTTKNVAQDQQQPSHANVSPKNSKEKRIEGKRGKITEYAQYLGLQPASKHKCSKCHSSTNFCSTLKQTQCTCSSAMAPMQGLPGTSDSSAHSLASNFKISRKVYLCAACGTYFENWNLFLHMRDIHKRHICLFCLGMFGQAERLSYHLAKKHSVPEMAFSSVEDFYSIFKGSCYLVCCTCEKVFSETDNFYNHFCSPPPKEEAIETVCTLCRQTGSHASTCSLATDTKLQASLNAQLGSSPVLERPVNKGAAKKIMRNNRTKLIDDNTTIPNRSKFSAQLKRTNSKGGVELHPIDNELPASAVVRDDIANYDDVTGSPAKDTVSETIMEVSKYLGESSSEENDEEVSEIEKISEGQLDSVSQTIMEVSRCSEEVEKPKETTEEDSTLIDESKNLDRTESPEGEIVPKDDLSTTGEETTDPVEPKTITEEAEEVEKENDKAECAHESKTDTVSHESNSTVNSPASSPVNRSLFSPQRELSTADPPQNEEQPEEKETKEEEQPTTESQSSVSFNTVTTSDRSLIIKICANKNSQFSVTAASAAATNGDDPESHNASRESEENNNGEESASDDKLSNVSEQDRCSVESDRAHEGDSDSDSDKLAVVDNNVEQTANPERNEEPETEVTEKLEIAEDKPEEKNEDAVDKEQPENEEQGLINIDTNGDIDVVGTSDVPEKNVQNDTPTEPEMADGVVLAGEDVPSIDLNVEGTLESMDIEDLLKRCIEVASPLCVYCNHARHIAVNGKQLGLHMLAEHKFQPQHPAIIIHPEQFVSRVRKTLQDLENRYFNLSSYNSTDGTYNVLNVRTYECFHCRFHSSVHKELYLHNRKMHQKTILVCVMCKSTFYSYSELLCHLCPGVYSPNINVKYRCCLCPVDGLPSAFRLMVHLRKRHHACDVCLESTGNQQRLSNHVWKHKLHHLCYRCGIAYRNKPDITKHLFWKHGTESVLCKKCLQKKWPHIYHFCIPPTAFVCEECGSSFSRAVALKVHKRLHSGDQPYSCGECSERFISKKLLARHERTHREPSPVNVTVDESKVEGQPLIDEEKSDKEKVANVDGSSEANETAKDGKENVKKVLDVYDLPPLNLSSESDTDSEDEKSEVKKVENGEKVNSEPIATSMSPAEATKSLSPAPVPESIVEVERDEEEKKQEERIMDGIWDNFKSYAASLEMQESGKNSIEEKEIETDVSYLRSIVLADHDYCVVWSDKDKKPTDEENAPKEEADGEEKPEKSPAESNAVAENETSKKKVKSPKKKKQNGSTSSSDSSSDSDSSSCSCGTNCSCSSSSSGSSSSSSSSSDSDSSASESSPRKQNSRKERKRDKDASQEVKTEADETEHVEVTGQVENGDLRVTPAEPEPPKTLLLRESDLETDETNTDEDFYDEHPQQLANKILAEKRNQLLLLAAVAPASAESTMSLNNGITDTDSMPAPSPDPIMTNPVEQPLQQKKKVKTKKRKKGERSKQRVSTPTVESIKLNIPKAYYQANSGFATSSPSLVTLQTSRSSTPVLSANDAHTPGQDSRYHSAAGKAHIGSAENENKRSSKRKRVPKRFYGDSSDEDADRPPATKWRKHEAPSFVTAPSPKRTASPRFSFAGKAVPPYRLEPQASNSIAPVISAAAAVASASDSDEPAESSSDSSDSETTEQPAPTQLTVAAQATGPPQERTNLYCYCQCPYDEVSEMIACDGEDCRIEWFHFECVGIMVPPKGKWYCPDCRKKHGMPLNSEDYFD